MADVAGHDVGTSYVTPAVKVLLKQSATPVYSVPESISYLNKILTRTVLEYNYLTAFALRVNRRAGKAVYLAAGHPPAILIPKNGRARLAQCENPFIGMIEDTNYIAETIDVVEGDRFILYTDGLVELGTDKKSWLDSTDELLCAIENIRHLPCEQLPAALVKAMGAENPDDDVAVMAVLV